MHLNAADKTAATNRESSQNKKFGPLNVAPLNQMLQCVEWRCNRGQTYVISGGTND